MDCYYNRASKEDRNMEEIINMKDCELLKKKKKKLYTIATSSC